MSETHWLTLIRLILKLAVDPKYSSMISLDSDLIIFSRGTILSQILLLWSQRYIKNVIALVPMILWEQYPQQSSTLFENHPSFFIIRKILC